MKWNKMGVLVVFMGFLVITACMDEQPISFPTPFSTERVAPTATTILKMNV